MALRTLKERLLQTVWYEAGGLLIVAPIYSMLFGVSSAHSILLLLCLSIIVMTWTPVHNTLFDRIEWHRTGRLASDRPHRWRVVHATSHEATSVVLTLPAIMVLGGFEIWSALVVDIGLTIFYSVYAYLFHLFYDQIRPVREKSTPEPARPHKSSIKNGQQSTREKHR